MVDRKSDHHAAERRWCRCVRVRVRVRACACALIQRNNTRMPRILHDPLPRAHIIPCIPLPILPCIPLPSFLPLTMDGAAEGNADQKLSSHVHVTASTLSFLVNSREGYVAVIRKHARQTGASSRYTAVHSSRWGVVLYILSFIL